MKKTICCGLLGLTIALASAHAVAFTLLPPHPLDAVFAANTVKEVKEALLDSELFRKAVKEALKTKVDHEEWVRRHPPVPGPSSTQLARRRFLEVLTNGR
jgi:hypothetical protein